jgi:hypothetical protein
MTLRRGLSFLLLIASLLASPVVYAGSAKDEPLPQNEVKGKVSSNYLALPRLHLTVMVDKNRHYRSLELEVWLMPKDEENLALARSAKKPIMAGLQEDFSQYDWEAFEDAKKGPEIAKQIVTVGVQRISGAKLQDVLIKTLLLR